MWRNLTTAQTNKPKKQAKAQCKCDGSSPHVNHPQSGVNWEQVHYLCVHVWPCRNLCIWTQHTWQSRNPPTMWLLDVEAPKRTRPWEIIRKDINVTNLHDQHGHDVFEPPDVNLLCHVWGNVFNIQVKFRPIFLHRCTELPAWYHSSSNIPLMWQTTVWIPDRPPSLSPLPQNISLLLAPFFPLFALSVFLTSWHTQRALSNRQTLWNTDTEKKVGKGERRWMVGIWEKCKKRERRQGERVRKEIWALCGKRQ